MIKAIRTQWEGGKIVAPPDPAFLVIYRKKNNHVDDRENLKDYLIYPLLFLLFSHVKRTSITLNLELPNFAGRGRALLIWIQILANVRWGRVLSKNILDVPQ